MRITELDQAIRAVCPIDGVNSSGHIAFSAGATDVQKAAAQAIMDVQLPSLDLSLARPPDQGQLVVDLAVQLVKEGKLATLPDSIKAIQQK